MVAKSANMTTRQSKLIDWLRFPMAVLIVLVHAGQLPIGPDDVSFYDTLRIVISHGVGRVAVPVFFFFSGYLFFTHMDHWDTQVWLLKVRKRLRTLLLPYLLWNIIALLASFAYTWLRSCFNAEIHEISFIELLRRNGWLRIFWDSTFGGPIDYPLWFIRDLIIFTILSPAAYFLLKKSGKWVLILLFFLCGVLAESRDFVGFFFFSFGAYFKISSRDFLPVFLRFKWPAYALSAAGLVVICLTYRQYPQWYYYLKYLFVFFGTISVICLSDTLLERNLVCSNAFLTSSTFFIYASHVILILHDVANYVTLHLFSSGMVVWQCLSLFFHAALAVGICLVLYALMKKITPKTLGVLTGSRA